MTRLPKKKPPARPLPLDARDVHRAEIGIGFEQWARANSLLVNLSDISHNEATKDGHGGGARRPPRPASALAALLEAEKSADLGTTYHNRLVAALGVSDGARRPGAPCLSPRTLREQHGEDDDASPDWPADRDSLAPHRQAARGLGETPSVSGSGEEQLLPQALAVEELAALSSEEIIYRSGSVCSPPPARMRVLARDLERLMENTCAGSLGSQWTGSSTSFRNTAADEASSA